jgi:hypothetical protein
MSKNFLAFLAIGLVVVGAVIAFTLVGTRGAHLRLDGKILKVREIATDEKSSIVVVDFRVRNEATKVQFVTREANIRIVTADGKEVAGDTIARSDMDRVFDYYKLLGPKFNQTFIMRDVIKGGESMDRMLAARFDLPAADVENRKNLILDLTDVDGAIFKILEKP